MKRLALLLALHSGTTGCTKHPVIVVASTAFTIGGLSCEIQDGDDDTLHTQKVCGIIAGVAALALGGIAALVTEFADTTAHEIPNDEEITPGGTVRLHTHTAPPPVPLDAGAVDSTIAPATAPVDAGVISPPDA